jgi:parallel beta-helix repeat protein
MVKFLPDSHPDYLQPDPAIATLTDGRYVVTWQSPYQDGKDAAVIARIYNASGEPLTAEFIVNTNTADSQDTPAIAALSDGGFIITWQSRDFGGTEYDIFAQRYNASGNRVGGEFRVNTYLSDFQTNSSVVALGSGGYVVIWQSGNQDGSEEGIYGQRYDSSNNRIGGEFRVNTVTSSSQTDPVVTTLTDGTFVVTWQSLNQDGSEYGVYGKRYGSNGVAIGGEFLINTTTNGSQNRSAIAALSNGGFVVTWNSGNSSTSSTEYDIYAQVFSSNTTKVGSQFLVNTFISDNQIKPSVAALSNGGFVITWRSLGQNPDDFGVYGQLYNANGVRVGSEFQVNTFATGDQGFSAVTALNNGGFVVTWHSLDQAGEEYGLYGQQFNASGSQTGGVFKINTFTPEIPPLDTTIPPGDDIIIVIAASNSNPISAASADFQATGVDDQNLINDAIAQINATGKGKVILLAGEYHISDNIFLRSNVQLVGSGYTTKLRLDDETSLSLSGMIRTQGDSDRTSEVPIYNSGVSNLQIDGNRDNQSFKNKKYGVYGTYDGAVFENLYIHDTASYGFDPHEDSRDGRGTYNITIRNNIVERAGLDGITLDKVIDSVVENNLTINNDRHGINAVSYSEDTQIINNQSIKNGGNGITIQTGSNSLQITGNEIANNKGNGIYIPGEGGNTIKDNTIISSGKYGIGVRASSSNIITDNLVIDSSQEANDTYSEIELYDNSVSYSTHNIVQGNITRSVLPNRSRYGIREKAAGNNYNEITDNIVSPSLRGDYFIKGPNTDFAKSNINTITGNASNNAITGTNIADRLIGLAGNDTLIGGNGENLLEGGLGDDSLVGGIDKDVIWGNDGNDILNGGGGDDYLNGDAGNDIINGDAGDDIIDGSLGSDTLNGGDGGDSIYGRQGFDSLNGGNGDDRLWGEEDNDTLIGGAGNDYLNGGTGNDNLTGNLGNDFLDGEDGNDVLDGEDGNDLLKGGAGNDLLNGGDGDDYITAGIGDDTVNGNADNDFLEGNDGNDILNGGDGNDILEGGAGIDTLTGGNGSDVLVGGFGNDIINLDNDTSQDIVMYAAGDGKDIVNSFDRGEDLFAITGISSLNVVVSGGSTEFRVANSVFGTGELLMTFVEVTGFTASNINQSLSSLNTANYLFS